MNNVSFTGLGLTKQGNPYEKCKTGRRIGAVTGFLGGATAMAAGGSNLMLGAAAKICGSNKKLSHGQESTVRRMIPYGAFCRCRSREGNVSHSLPLGGSL